MYAKRWMRWSVHVELPEHRLDLRVEPLLRLGVRLRVAERELAVPVDRHTVLGPREVLGREPEVDRVPGDPLERPLRRELRRRRALAAEHGRLRLADHLDVAERELEVVAAREVEVVQRERLLEDRRVLLAREREHGHAVVEHVVAPDLVRAVREAVRVLVARRLQQQLCRVRRSARDDDDVGREALGTPVTLDLHLGDSAACGVRRQLDHLRVGQQRDVLVLERRPHPEHLCVRLGVDETREPVARRAADARAVGHVRLVQPDPAGGVEGLVPRGRQLVRQLLDPRLVRDGRVRVRCSPAARWDPRRGRRAPRRAAPPSCSTARARRTRSARPVRRRRDGVARRSPPCAAGRAPRRRTWSRRRRSSGSAAGTPCLSRRTRCPPRCSGCRRTRPAPTSSAARAEASRRARAGESASRGSEVPGESAAARAGADDDHVVGLHQVTSFSRSARMIRAAASIRARWENAWGKLPRWRPVAASNSSA